MAGPTLRPNHEVRPLAATLGNPLGRTWGRLDDSTGNSDQLNWRSRLGFACRETAGAARPPGPPYNRLGCPGQRVRRPYGHQSARQQRVLLSPAADADADAVARADALAKPAEAFPTDRDLRQGAPFLDGDHQVCGSGSARVAGQHPLPGPRLPVSPGVGTGGTAGRPLPQAAARVPNGDGHRGVRDQRGEGRQVHPLALPASPRPQPGRRLSQPGREEAHPLPVAMRRGTIVLVLVACGAAFVSLFAVGRASGEESSAPTKPAAGPVEQGPARGGDLPAPALGPAAPLPRPAPGNRGEAAPAPARPAKRRAPAAQRRPRPAPARARSASSRTPSPSRRAAPAPAPAPRPTPAPRPDPGVPFDNDG